MDVATFERETAGSHVCGESSNSTGFITDDFASQIADGHACIYRIRSTNHRERIKLKLFDMEDCHDEYSSHIYVVVDGMGYGPYCNRTGEKARHRRYDAFISYSENMNEENYAQPADNGALENVRLCAPCRTDSGQGCQPCRSRFSTEA